MTGRNSIAATVPRRAGHGVEAGEALDDVSIAQVERALRAGWTWSQVADALGVTRQAVHKKHAKRLAAGGAAQGRR